MTELEKIREERDALAAHVSELKCVVVEMAHDEGEEVVERYFTQELMDASPCGNILARRDALMKAKALEEVSMLYPSEVCAEFDSIRADLQGAAYHYRKQVEED